MRKSYRRVLVLAAILLCVTMIAAAKPNFTGDWKLNAAKSQFGEMPAPSSMTNKITHDDPNLATHMKQVSDMGEMEMDAKYTTDGKECTNTMRDNPVTSVVKWDGDALMFESKGKFGDADFTMKDKWTLSGDGKVLTIERAFSSSFGEGKQTMVLDKQ